MLSKHSVDDAVEEGSSFRIKVQCNRIFEEGSFDIGDLGYNKRQDCRA